MVRRIAWVLLGVVFLLVQGNLFRPLRWLGAIAAKGFGTARFSWIASSVPDLVFLLVLFFGVSEFGVVEGAAFSFVLGYATDVISAAPVGLFAFTYMAIHLSVRATGLRLSTQGVGVQFLFALLAAMVHAALLLLLLATFGDDPYPPRTLLARVPPHAIATALAAPLVFAIARRASSVLDAKQRRLPTA